jgi:SAM-dependent methyltransferase
MAFPTNLLHCPACGEQRPHKMLYVKNKCGILRCDLCGLGRADATGFDPAGYYTHDYFSGGHADGYADYAATEPVLRRQFAREVGFLRRLCPTGRLVEIGCAFGFFLREARRHYAVGGIELSQAAAAHCRDLGLNVATGEASEQILAQFAPVDVFVLLDVIEHLSEPFETLDRCMRSLQPNGRIVLTTGDFASPVARLAGSSWRLMTPPQHLWFFTCASFQRWSSRNGMRVESYDHPWKIVPLSLIAFQLARSIGRSVTLPTGARVGIPVNLFDAMRIVLRKEA